MLAPTIVSVIKTFSSSIFNTSDIFILSDITVISPLHISSRLMYMFLYGCCINNKPEPSAIRVFCPITTSIRLTLDSPAIIVAGEKLGVVKKEKPMVENDFFEIACGYGIFIIGSSQTGEMQVYAIYGSKQVEKIAGLGTSYKVEKFNEHTIKVICKYKEGAILTKYTFIGI